MTMMIMMALKSIAKDADGDDDDDDDKANNDSLMTKGDT